MGRRFFDINSAINAIVKNKDAQAFEFIFNTFYDKLYRVAYYYMSSDANAADMVSEVFYKLWLNANRLNKIENLENYLFFMTRNQCLSALRTEKKLMYTSLQSDFRQQITTANPESALISQEFIQHLHKHKEVADILNISVKTVENQMTKAIGYLRKIVADYDSKSSSSSKFE